MAGKRIGFVDYKLENFHANTFLKNIRGGLKDRGYEVAGCFALDAEGGKAWGEKNGVAFYRDVAELDRQVDAYVVLAPSNPETHVDLCRRVFPHQKMTYVDKTFAPDLKTAQQIFDLADQHRVPVQTTSALRYTAVQKKVEEVGRENVRHMVAWGQGSSFGEYGIHPVELVVSCMGPEAESMMRRGTDPHSQLLVNFSGDRTAVVNVVTEGDTPFAATITTPQTTAYVPVDLDTLFLNMTGAILDFFDAGKATINRGESLMIRRILDAAERPEARKGFVKL